jgi:hypothetical protein
MLTTLGNFASCLPSINLISHAHFGARDDAKAVTETALIVR